MYCTYVYIYHYDSEVNYLFYVIRTEMGLDQTGNRLIFVFFALFCGFMHYSVAVDKQTRIIKKLKI